MYDHPDFNYIAYNTLRMYDERLARPENAVGPPWDAIRWVIRTTSASSALTGDD